jgi:GTP-binding protein Era
MPGHECRKKNNNEDTMTDTPVNTAGFRAGYIALAGLANVGKSTLMNRIVGSKLSIVTPKPQTTRGVVRGILTTKTAQIIFFDTAGIHRPHDKLGTYMVESARATFRDADIIYLLLEAGEPSAEQIELVEHVSTLNKPTFLIINKVDLVRKDTLLPLIKRCSSLMNFKEIVPISALQGDNVDELVELTVGYLPLSAAYYPEDILSDQIERDFIAEFIREQVFKNTREEIPYSSAVVIDEMQERKNGGAFIRASIVVEKDSQKGIVLGKGGSMIKKIGIDARREIESFMGYKVFLELFVKVEKKWRENPKSLKKLGFS